ncbi:MAG: hypothetical protein A2Y73_09075, partial [Chloroflexi bacterium RBG_13_56_8]
FALRSIPAYERIKQLASHAAESGQPIHIGMGTGQLGGDATPEASMGITVFDYVAHHAATSDQPVSATVGDPTILPMAQGILLAARGEAGFPERYTGREVHFYGNDPLAYGAGVLAALQQRDHLASILLGRYGSEGLWIAETTRRHEDIVQLGGTVDPAAATLMRASLDDAVFGEEMFAAGAYLHRASHLGSLAMQDGARILIVIGIIVGVVMTSLGYW